MSQLRTFLDRLLRVPSKRVGADNGNIEVLKGTLLADLQATVVAVQRITDTVCENKKDDVQNT